MDAEEFRQRGKQMVDYIADYMENISKRRVVPLIEPGYLRECLPDSAPSKPESYDKVMHDVEEFIMSGVTHWQHPRFHAYFPAGNSYPSILADMLSDATGCMGFSWAANPACTELETIMLDWLGKMIGLPPEFLPFCENGKGGGVIQGSASECILVSLLAARFATIKELKQRYPFVEDGILLSKLIAYCSKEAHSSVEKACMIGFVKLRILETDEKFRLRGQTLKFAIEEDRSMGLIPFFVKSTAGTSPSNTVECPDLFQVSTTLGTTSCCSFDALNEIGPVCTQENIWLHVDAAYAGSAFICTEFQYLMNGVEHAMSFNLNPNKWMLVNFDCSTMWVKDRFKLTQALVVDPLYLQHSYSDKSIDYRHWGIPLSRRFRALKLWFVIRMYGIEGLQRYIREHVRLAKKFERLVAQDSRFDIVNEVVMGLVCFRLHAPNDVNKKLLTRINASGKLHMVPASLNDRFVIRFCVCAESATDEDIQAAWELIRSMATQTLDLEHRHKVGEFPNEQTNTQLKRLHLRPGDAATVDDSGTELFDVEDEASSNGNETENEEQPSELNVDKSGTSLDSRRNHSLSYKRSFFVRMVSDPKAYNPKIVRTLSTSRRRLSDDLKRDMSLRCDIKPQCDTGVQTPV